MDVTVEQAARDERWEALRDLDEWLRTPMLVLSVVWLGLVVAELLGVSNTLLETFGTAIWVVFIAEFALRLFLAPDKSEFLKASWLTIISLIVPAFRILRGVRALRAVRALRGARLVRVIGTANRSMIALKATLARRAFGYVIVLTVVVVALGAAGMLSFEPAGEVPGGFTSYGDALWWTAMLVATLGSEFWPKTTEGRVLCFLLAMYGFAVFGYITASFASFFVGRDADTDDAPVVGAKDLARLSDEIAALRAALGGPQPSVDR